MASSITFNGITKFAPGGITRVTSDVLDNVGLNATGVIGIIGEADGGEPGETAGLISFRDPSRAIQTYKSGPLVDAIRLAFQSSADPRIPSGATEVVVYKVNESTQSIVNLPHTQIASTTTTATNTSTNTVVSVVASLTGDYTGYWVGVQIDALPGGPSYLRRIVSNTTSTITVTPALPVAPTTLDNVIILSNIFNLTSKDYGTHTNGIEVDLAKNADSTYQVTVTSGGTTEISNSLGGTPLLKLLYTGGALAVPLDTFATAGSSNSVLSLTAGGLVVAAHTGKTVKIIPNVSSPDPIYRKISTNAAGTITLATPLTDDEFDSLVNSSSTIEILTVTDAVGEFYGSSGVATEFGTTITGVTGDDLSIAITDTMTLNELVTAINANINYQAEVPSPAINGDTVLAKDFDFAVATPVNLQTTIDDSAEGFKQDVKAIVDWFNNVSVYVSAERATARSTDGSCIMDGLGDLYPADIGFVFATYNGTRGTSANSDWQAGFDKLITRPMNLVVPLIDQDLVNEGFGSTATWSSVSQQLLAHIIQGRGVAGLERGGFLGIIGTKAQYIAACNSLGDADIQLVSQYPTILSASGTLYEATPKQFAVMAASMRAGVPDLGEPLTHKFILTTGIRTDSSWDPGDLTDIADLVSNGALFAETVPGQGVRWVRDITTWIRDTNLCYTEGSIRSVVREIAYNLRVGLVNRFVGRRALPATIANVKDVASTILENYRSQGAIVDSTDPTTGITTKAYNNLRVYSQGDAIYVLVCIFPVPGINFILNDIFVRVPSQSA